MLKKLLITIVAISAIGFFIYYLWRYSYKPRASTIKATLNFTDASIDFKQGETKDIYFTLTTENPNNYKISGVNLYFKFNLNNNDLLEFVDATASAVVGSSTVVNYFDEVIKKEVFSSSNYNGCKILRFAAVAKKTNENLAGNINFRLTFKALKKAGSGSISLHASVGNIQNQVVGITGTSDNLFSLRVSRDATNYTINNNASCANNNDCGSNALCQGGLCVCSSNYYNCDNNWNNGCESSNQCQLSISPTITATPTPTSPPEATATPTSTTTPTPTPTSPPGNVTLNLKLKFQGILKKPAAASTMPVRVKIGGRMLPNPTDYKTAIFTVGDDGIWRGSVSFDLLPDSEYIVYIKGPKHIQKKICQNTPTESFPGTYRCSTGNITLNAGANILDFSGILQLAGDLPEQDGIVNSYDISLIRNNLDKTDAEALRLADLNLDGRVITQDYSLIIAALSVRADEE